MELKSTKKLNEKTMVFLFFLAWGFTFFNRLSINFAMPVIQQSLGITDSDTGIVVFASTVAMAISAIVVGRLSDKQGKRKKFLVPSVLLVGLGSAASVLASSFGAFVAVRVIVGLGLGPVLGMIFAVTESESGENKFGANTGIIMAGDAFLASIVGPILITQLTKVMSWQLALSVTGIPTILVALLIAKAIPEVEVHGAAAAQEGIPAKRPSPLAIFKCPNIVQCTFLAVLTLGAYFAIVTYAPMYLTEIAGCSMETMGFITSAMGIIFIFYAILIPRSTDKFGRKPIMIITNLLCALAPLMMFLFPGSMVGIAGYVLFGGASGAIHVFFNTIIPLESLPDELKTTGSSILMAIGEILGSASIPLLAGLVADRFGYGAVMLMSAILFGVAFLISFTLKESNKSVAK